MLDGRKRKLGPAHPGTLAAEVSLGEVLLEQQKHGDAEAHLRAAVDGCERAASVSWRRYHAQCLLGSALLAQHRNAEAAPQLREAYRGLTEYAATIPVESRRILDDCRQRVEQLGR